MEDARALFFGGEQPRATWLCVSSDEYGQHSLHTYFPGLSNQTFTQQFAMMGGRNVKVTHADQTLFKADRLQSYGVHKWVAFGKTHPIHSVADQLGVCVTTAGAVFPAPELVGSRARRRRSPAHIDEDAAAAAATPPTMAPRDHDDDGVHHNDVHDDDDSESYDPDGPNSDDDGDDHGSGDTDTDTDSDDGDDDLLDDDAPADCPDFQRHGGEEEEVHTSATRTPTCLKSFDTTVGCARPAIQSGVSTAKFS